MPFDLVGFLTGGSTGNEMPDPLKENDPGSGQADLVQFLTGGKTKPKPEQPLVGDVEVENPLPPGAKGFTPAGTPYFGEGISGILKGWKYNLTKDVNNVTDDEWNALWDRWRDAWHIEQTVSAAEGNKMQVGLAAQTAEMLWRDATQDGSVLSPLLKGVGATIGAAAQVLGIPAKWVEQSMGAATGFSEYANSVDSPLPALDTPAERAIENIPLVGFAYDFTRIALSNSDNKWEETRQAIRDGWDAGRIFYSQLLDKSKKEQFLARLRAGEDPGLIALELENPYAEGIGGFLLDPLNFVGWIAKGAKTAKELAVVDDAVTASGLLKTEAGRAAFKAIDEAADEASGAKAFAELTKAQADAVAQVTKKSRLLNVGYSPFSLTTSSRQGAIISKGKDLLGNMAMVMKNNGLNEEAIAEGILNGVRSVSANASEMQKGLAGLKELPSAHVWLSDDYIETFTVLNRMMTNTDGVVDGGKLRRLLEVKNPEQFATEVEALYKTATAHQFKDVTSMRDAARLVQQAAKNGGEVTKETQAMADAYNALPNYVKVLNNINENIHRFTDPINRVLFPMYFNWQGGVAFRNYISNFELVFIDKGPSAWFREGKYWTVSKQEEFLKDLYGVMPESTSGFKTLGEASTGSKSRGFGKLSDLGERQAATRIVAASVRDTLDKMLAKAMPNFAKEIEAGILTDRQVSHLGQLIRRNNYNVRRAIEEFRKIYKTGAIEDWRNLDYVGKFERQTLEAFDLMDDIENLARNGAASQDEIEKVFAKLQQVIDSRSELVVKDPLGISPDHSAIESWGDLAQAVEDGHLSPEEHAWFTAVMEYSEQARLEYQTLLDDVGLKAVTALQQEGRAQEANAIGVELNRVRNTLRRSAPATAKRTHEITQDAWRWTEEIKRLKKPKKEELVAYWSRAGLPGVAPLDIDRKILLRAIWDNRYAKVTEAWNSSFDAVVAESETVLRQMEKVVDATELKSMAARTRFLTKQAQAIRAGAFRNGSLKIFSKADIEKMAEVYGITTDEIVQAVNNIKGTSYATIDDLETHDILSLFKGKLPGEPEGIPVPPPHPIGTAPTPARIWHESANGLKYTLDRVKNEMLARWGRMTPGSQINPEMERVLAETADTLSSRMDEAKIVAARIAQKQREFTLLNYGERTYMDAALAHVFPFHFFYNRSYRNWMTRVATNPALVSQYGRYKHFLETQNRDLPDWYKQQLNINPLDDGTIFGKEVNVPFLGILEGHPLYLNMEATFNPLYGLTGTDFYDKTKRANWLLATIDDMGKFGPTMYAPIQLGIAAMLFRDGETDAAARWGSRVFPETAQIKAITSMFGRPIELDPAVNFFSGGIDPQERGRLAYAAGELISSGQYTPEEVMTAMHEQSGPIWDLAYQMAVQSRSASAMTSYFFGVGFKPRSTNDVQVEQMYTDLNKLYAMSDMMSAEQYRLAWEQLRSKYPNGLVDTVLLARKGGDQRDAALAYNVLNRIAPGDASDALKTIGLSSEEVSKFYDSKGFTNKKVKWTPQEKDRFMAAILDLSAMLKMPDNATRMEWAEARTRNSEIYERMREIYGEDIQQKTSFYYDLKDDDREAAQQFAQLHPEIFDAMQYRRAVILSDPLLSAYYGGIETVEMYIDGRVRKELSDKYGRDIYNIQAGYFDSPNPKSYLRQHPELKSFWNEKRQLEARYEPFIYSLAAKLPEGSPTQFREDFEPQSYTQEELFNALQPQDQIPSWEEVSVGMPEWLQTEIKDHAATGRPISKRGQKELDYLANVGNYYDADQLLLMATLALQK